jgi:hypothetical protein
VTADALFPDGPYRVDPPPDARNADDTRTEGEKLRARQQARIAAGLHPLSMSGRYLKLHPDAPHDAARDDGGTYPRCGTCVHRVTVGVGARAFPKCNVGGRDTASTASDVRAWWPACGDHEARP